MKRSQTDRNVGTRFRKNQESSVRSGTSNGLKRLQNHVHASKTKESMYFQVPNSIEKFIFFGQKIIKFYKGVNIQKTFIGIEVKFTKIWTVNNILLTVPVSSKFLKLKKTEKLRRF
jgi:hypothetical protein